MELAPAGASEDLQVRATSFDPLELLCQPGGHDAAMALEARSDVNDWRPIPPFDFEAGYLSIAPIPGGNATVRHVTVGSPVGLFTYHDTFVDGTLVGRHGGEPPEEPLVSTRLSFAARVAPPDTPLLEQRPSRRIPARMPVRSAVRLSPGPLARRKPP
jgi:hypothetical protein